MKTILLLSTLLIFSCTKKADTPEGLLEQFAVDMTTKKLDREYFDKYTTGKMLEKIESLNDEELEKYSNLSHVKKPKIDITNSNCSGDKCSLTYIIKYNLVKNQKIDFKTEVKKLATVVKGDDGWKIEEVVNLKTYHEAAEPINAMEDPKTN